VDAHGDDAAEKAGGAQLFIVCKRGVEAEVPGCDPCLNRLRLFNTNIQRHRPHPGRDRI